MTAFKIPVCPEPGVWNDIHTLLCRYASQHDCDPPQPPVPLILSAWVFSNDLEKLLRWQETCEWAERNGAAKVLERILEKQPETQFYKTYTLTDYPIGPMGGPMYLPWDFTSKEVLSADVAEQLISLLKQDWAMIVGSELASITYPLRFAGKKSRCLLVAADKAQRPPWGGWTYLSGNQAERRTFTELRKAINARLSPHTVDHINFMEKDDV